MAYAISMKSRAIRGLKKIRKQDKRRVADCILDLASDPRPSGAKAIQEAGKEDNALRVRLGAFRVVYRIDDDNNVIHVDLVSDRKDAYKDRS